MSKIQLKLSSILEVPLQFYEKDFTFIVNGRQFQTSRVISDLLSPKICQNHFNDTVSNEFTINTSTEGDFSHILNLVNFDQLDLTENDLPFVLEVLEILGNKSIDLTELNEPVKLTTDNIFKHIKNHEKFSTFYSKRLSEEIDFISANFDSLYETKNDELQSLDINMIDFILNNDKLRIENEDLLLEFVNKMYEKDKRNSFLYESIEFSNLSLSSIDNFVSIFDINDVTNELWKKLCERLTLVQFKSHKFIQDNEEIDDMKLCEAVSLYYNNDPSTLVFVKNIPYEAGGKDIALSLYQFGEIKQSMVLAEYFQGDYFSLGVGIIQFATKEAQQKAVAVGKVDLKLENSSKTCVLNISQAKKNDKYDTAIIEFIPKEVKERDIISAFKFIKPIQVEITQDLNRSIVLAYAKFKSPNSLNSAIQYNKTILLGNIESKVSMSTADFNHLYG